MMRHELHVLVGPCTTLLHAVKLVEADSVGALISSFARQKGKKCSSDTRIHHLQLLLKLSPKGIEKRNLYIIVYICVKLCYHEQIACIFDFK